MKIQSSNGFHVATYDPSASENGTTGYSLMKEIKGNKVKFSIQCLNKPLNIKYTSDVCRTNEKIMAHYMVTGELNERFVDSKFTGGTSASK